MSTPSFYAVIPANVRYCKEIEPGAKLLYGELTALAQKEGFCWATNKYLASLYDVDHKTIQRWIRSLQDQKFISVEVEVGGFQTIRRIWISPEFKKIYTKGQKCLEGETKTVTPDDKNVLHINTMINTYNKDREKDKPSTHTFSFSKSGRVKLDNVKLTKLYEEFGEKKIQEMIERLDEYADINPKRFKQYACHATVIRKWIREETEKASKTPYNRLSNDQTTKDKIVAEIIISKVQGTISEKDISIGHDYIEFRRGQFTDVIHFGDNGFRAQCINSLRKMNLIFHNL